MGGWRDFCHFVNFEPAAERNEQLLRSKDGAELLHCVRNVISETSFPGEAPEALETRRIKWASLLLEFQKYGHFSFGNRLQVLEGGDACFAEMLSAINSARTRVWCESYIFDRSSLAEQFVRALADAARRGCDVILLVDYIGSISMPSAWVSDLRGHGVEVVFFNPILPHACVGPISFRDHRKITIADELGFCGGMNIQEEVGEKTFGTSRFYDVHARLEGPCVADLADVFLDSLRESGGLVHRVPIVRPEPLSPGVYVQVLQSNVRMRRRTLQQVITQAIDSADESVLLTTAYFFPPGFLRRVLVRAPQRQTRLSLLLSGSSDFQPVPGDLLAQTHFLRRFLNATKGHEDKVGVHLYCKRHMHAKHMVIDGVFSHIGSFNFDLYSARRNLEVGVSVFDRSFAASLEQLHNQKVLESEKTTLNDRSYHRPLVQVACAIAYGCVRLSGRNLFDGLDVLQEKWLVRKSALTFLLEEQAAHFIAASMMWGID